METRTYTGILLMSDVVNHNGRMYPKEVMQKAIEEYQTKINDKTSIGQLGYGETPGVDLNKASHTVNNLSINDNTLYVEATFLKTEAGIAALEMLKSGEAVIRPYGIGTVNDNGMINDDYRLMYTAVIPKKDDAFLDIIK